MADFPTDDAVADATRMNRWIEDEIRQNPARVPLGASPLQDATAGRAIVVLASRATRRQRDNRSMRVRFAKMQGPAATTVVLDATRAPIALDAAG
jgi:hypothetical protein